MTVLNPNISHADVIPELDTGLFTGGHDAARFAVGVLAVGDEPLEGLENEYSSYYDLRKRVYVDQTGQLHEDEVGVLVPGRDTDHDDYRSIAMGVFENKGGGRARTVGGVRLIIKGMGIDPRPDMDKRPLPVEEDWPEIFTEPLQPGSDEVSRLIARHERAGTQEVVRRLLYGSALRVVKYHKLGRTFGIVEPWFAASMKRDVPMQPIGDAKWIDKYLDYNLPIEVDTATMVQQFGIGMPENQAALHGMQYIGEQRRPNPKAA